MQNIVTQEENSSAHGPDCGCSTWEIRTARRDTAAHAPIIDNNYNLSRKITFILSYGVFMRKISASLAFTKTPSR